MIYLVSYDISDNRLRKKIADKLLEYGLYRLQYSVFAGHISDSLSIKLKVLLVNKMNDAALDSDKILIIPITQQNLALWMQLGKEQLDLEKIAGLKNTLYIG